MTDRYKYPRTPHLNWSPGLTNDDRVMKVYHQLFIGEVVITEKMDGENTTLYPDGYTHARSTDSKYHESRTWIKADWASKAHNLPDNMRIVGENLFAQHSIHYKNLLSYFYGFAVFQDDMCLSWDRTVEILDQFNYPTPRVLYRGPWLLHTTKSVIDKIEQSEEPVEGYVVRTTREFPIDKFELHVAKYVRADHVQSNQHWMHQQIIQNELAADNTNSQEV